MAGRSERQGQPPGGEWEGAERESAAHSPGLALSLWQQEKGEPQGRVKTHVHVVHGLGGHTEVTKAVLLGRVVLVGPQKSSRRPFSFMVSRMDLNFFKGILQKGWGQGRASLFPTAPLISQSLSPSLTASGSPSLCPRGPLLVCVCLPLSPFLSRSLALSGSFSLCLSFSLGKLFSGLAPRFRRQLPSPRPAPTSSHGLSSHPGPPLSNTP